MSIVIKPSLPVIAAHGVTADVVLQPGSVISARVLQVLGNDQVRIAIGGQSIDVQSQVPLQAGQTLQLAVSQTADGIRLAVVDPQAGDRCRAGARRCRGWSLDQVTLAPDAAVSLAAQAPAVALANQLTPQEALAVSTAAQSAATQQTEPGAAVRQSRVAAGLDSLPPQVQQAVAQLLAQRTSLDQNLTGADVQAGVRRVPGCFSRPSGVGGGAVGARRISRRR